MNSLILLMIIEAVILILPSFFLFKTRKEFFKCLHSFLFVETLGSWQTVYKTHVRRSLKFAIYFVIVLFASVLNLVFQDTLAEITSIDESLLLTFKLAEGYGDISFFIFLFA